MTSAWETLSPEIEAFLVGHESGAGSGACFADRFLSADPRRLVVTDRAALVAALPNRRALFANAGIRAVHRIAATQLDLDPQHLIVTAEWRAERPGRDAVCLESTFMLRREPDGLRIVVYLNHHDITTVLAEPEAPCSR